MDLIETEVPGVLVLIPRRFGDSRGWLSETWNARTLSDHGLRYDFVQDNESYTAKAGTLRGLHYQAPPHAQAKLVRCVTGRILDVTVDVRRGSPSYGVSVARELTADGGEQLLIPEGFLHGFLTLQADCRVGYKCSAHYEPVADGSVRWDSLGIDWGLGDDVAPILSPKDENAIPFSAWESPFSVGAP